MRGRVRTREEGGEGEQEEENEGEEGRTTGTRIHGQSDGSPSSQHDASSGVREPVKRTEGARSIISLPLTGAAKATLLSVVVAFPPAPMAPAASARVHLQ